MKMYDDFESVRNLDSSKQRSLLVYGDFVEKIWAAWALALKYDKEIVPELLVCLQNSPVPGTRRHLIVVLAGLGQLERLRTLVREDPDEYVRATACSYLIKTYQAGDKRTCRLLSSEAAHDPSAVVRSTILHEITSVNFTLQGRKHLKKHLEKLARDPDPEVRVQAERILSFYSRG